MNAKIYSYNGYNKQHFIYNKPIIIQNIRFTPGKRNKIDERNDKKVFKNVCSFTENYTESALL